VGGSTSNWDNLATLLAAGIEGVREVDPTILVMLHVENTDDLAGVRWWVDNALTRGVEFDVLGLSCYTAFQGAPSVWEATFNALAADYPDLSFVIAEYNPERTLANTIIRNLPDGRGLGTFFWEPTRSGEWGDALFTWQGNSAVANSSDFAEYDALLPTLGLD
jgi:arabinogalactan endo-1,4-beta-galactosidase